jgi:peptidoglycan L-alanyl-D-glutamate endopeptidase CwlK
MSYGRPERLHGVHPDLAAKVTRILDAMERLGFPMMVTEGLRTTERQQALYAQGRIAPGKIVTFTDGVVKKSNHQAKADGFGYAVDCVFLVDIDGDGPDDPSWAERHPWTLYGVMAEALGLRWGGRFKTLVDRPHVEMKA